MAEQPEDAANRVVAPTGASLRLGYVLQPGGPRGGRKLETRWQDGLLSNVVDEGNQAADFLTPSS